MMPDLIILRLNRAASNSIPTNNMKKISPVWAIRLKPTKLDAGNIVEVNPVVIDMKIGYQ